MKVILISFSLMLGSQLVQAQTTMTVVKKQLTVDTREFDLIKILNSPRWFKTKSGIYRVSFKLKDSTEVKSKINQYHGNLSRISYQ